MKTRNTCEVYAAHDDKVSAVAAKMPSSQTFELCASFFKALSDPTRTKIIWALNECEMCGCDLSELLGMTPSAISHQLSGLKKARMVKSRKVGKEVFYSLDDDHISAMLISGIQHTEE